MLLNVQIELRMPIRGFDSGFAAGEVPALNYFKRTHPANRHRSSESASRNLAADEDSTLKSRNIENVASLQARNTLARAR